MSVVVISTVTFVLGTMPELTDNIDIMLFDNETEVRSTSLEQLALYDVCVPDRDPSRINKTGGEMGGGEWVLTKMLT